MFGMHKYLLWFVCLMLSVTVPPVHAQDAGQAEQAIQSSPLMVHSKEMRRVTNSNETSDSTCIGYTISPICTIETYLAFQARDDDELRDIALGRIPGPPKGRQNTQYYTAIIGYRVLAVRQFTEHFVPFEALNRFNIQPGDVTIDVETTICRNDEPCVKGSLKSNENHILRKGEFGWYIAQSGARGFDLTDPCDIGLRSGCSD